MRNVTVYEVTSKSLVVESDFIAFHRMPDLDFAHWQRVRDKPSKFIKHHAPVVHVRDGGEDYYVAVNPDCVDRIALAVAPQLKAQIKELEKELAEMKKRAMRAEDLHCTAASRFNVEQNNHDILKYQIEYSGVLDRLRYLFTRKFPQS
jgi:hypothetical protein